MQNDFSFTYDDYQLLDDRSSVVFSYTLRHEGNTHTFKESYGFGQSLPDCYETNQLLKALHLVGGINYYKIFVPPSLQHPYEMSADEAGFWNEVFRGGLGEFLYVNKLEAASLAQFSPQTGKSSAGQQSAKLEESAMLGVGGGKDSIVAGEALKSIGLAVEGFVVATGTAVGQSSAVAKVMGVSLHKVERELDPLLQDVQKQPDAYRGHVPISATFALVGSLLAIANRHRYVVVANESSSSIPRGSWAGRALNHQWSKSLEFEKTLQAYLHEHVNSELTYFSAIRPLSSIAVARAFAKLPQYFEVFTSDNFVFRIDPGRRPVGRWGLESPKSLSSFILLAPWLDDKDMQTIFGQNFLDEMALEKLFWELLGVEGDPPLDCVGTVEELVLSLNLAYAQGKYHDAQLMRLAKQRGVLRDQDWGAEQAKLLLLSKDMAFPEALSDSLIRELGQ